jgi:hypothetical protein
MILTAFGLSLKNSPHFWDAPHLAWAVDKKRQLFDPDFERTAHLVLVTS